MVGGGGLEPPTSSLYRCAINEWLISSDWWAIQDLNLGPRHYQ